jgi:probable O-glycosylation ligase (exosortase A-associated)
MHDLFLLSCLLVLMGLGLCRSFLFVLAYIYIDITTPQQLTYWLLQPVPVSMIGFTLAFVGWLVSAGKDRAVIGWTQVILTILMCYCLYTTLTADFPDNAMLKWDWVWKVLLFGMFLPLTLITPRRIEAVIVVAILSASALIVPAGIKTLVTGGGYATLDLMVEGNSGLHESSTLSCVAIMILPLLSFLQRNGRIFPPGWTVSLYTTALGFACILVTIGTQARTGLVCIAVLGLLRLRTAKYRSLYLGGALAATLIAIPFLPASFMDRMSTIKTTQSNHSAATRLAVWAWTLDYATSHPMGGGFDAYLGNKVRYETVASADLGSPDGRSPASATSGIVEDKARAYHSSYFEMLGEQGWPGLFLWLGLHGLGLVRMERLFKAGRRATDPHRRWLTDLAGALQQAHLIYLVGAVFVGIAYLPFSFMILGLEAGLNAMVRPQSGHGMRRHMRSFGRHGVPADCNPPHAR